VMSSLLIKNLRLGLLVMPLLGLSLIQLAEAQTQFMYLKDQIVSPAYEGWWPNEDGSSTLFFGYMNSNWEQHYDIEVGPNNHFTAVEAGELDDLGKTAFDFAQADQGQPTHFYPRRNPFLFTVIVPEDFGEKELVWTLTSRGKVARAYATLKVDYRIDPQVISTEVGGDFGSLSDLLRTNIPPEINVEGEMFRTVGAGQPLNLAVVAHDPDNLPARRGNRGGMPQDLESLYRPPSAIVVMSAPGLRFAWTVYRGRERHATFTPAQQKTFTDSRAYANSPWSPPYTVPEVPEDNRWVSTVTFDQPGEYVLRGVASDGSMFSYQNINVTVTP